MSIAVRPGLAPTLASSPIRISYFRFDNKTVVTSSFSRAWVHSDCTVYIAEPSACRLITRRPGAPIAAPVAIGMPPPIAPPVTFSQS